MILRPGWTGKVAWAFWHPWSRCVLSVLSVFLGVLLYAEDPVGHSEVAAKLNFVGPVINLILCASSLDLVCLLTLSSALTGGILLSRLLIHPWLRNTKRYSAFGYISVSQMTQLAKSDAANTQLEAQRSKGRFTVTTATVTVFLVAAAQVLPLLAYFGDAQCDSNSGFPTFCRLGTALPINNINYTRATACFTLGLDLLAIMLMLEAMLQEGYRGAGPGAGGGASTNCSSTPTNSAGQSTGPSATTVVTTSSGNEKLTLLQPPQGPQPTSASAFKESSPKFPQGEIYLTRAPAYKIELVYLRKLDALFRCKGFPLPPAAVLGLTTFLIGAYMMFDQPFRWTGTCSEIGRVFLSSARLCVDVLLVLQDWEFPHFRQMRRISLLSWFDLNVTGKWLNYGVLAMTLLLDVNTVRYHLLYHPSRFGQRVQKSTHVILTHVFPGTALVEAGLSAGKSRRFRSAYSYFYNYSLGTKLLFTFPVWIAMALLIVGVKRWRIRPSTATPELTFITSGAYVPGAGTLGRESDKGHHFSLAGLGRFSVPSLSGLNLLGGLVGTSGGGSSSALNSPSAASGHSPTCPGRSLLFPHAFQPGHPNAQESGASIPPRMGRVSQYSKKHDDGPSEDPSFDADDEGGDFLRTENSGRREQGSPVPYASENAGAGFTPLPPPVVVLVPGSAPGRRFLI